MGNRYDCVVIGAGAAGIAAGALLTDAGKTFAVFEAQDRIGGRAYSVPLSDGAVVEAGAAHVIGSRIATWEYIDRAGLRTQGGRLEVQSPVMVLRDGDWHREGDDARPVKGATYWIAEGHSELWKQVTAPFAAEIRHNAPVTAVDWSRDGVVVHTDGGEYRAAAAIVTLSVGVLSAGAVEFRPSLPAAKLEALDGLGMDSTGRVMAEFRHPFWTAAVGDAVRFKANDSIFEWHVPYRQRATPPLLTFSGASGPTTPWDELTRDPGSLEAAVLANLGAMFPSVDVRAELVEMHVREWSADPWIRGTASMALQGKEHLRGQLAAPTPPLYWAGEATRTDGSARTVHGALLSGRTAVVEAMHQMRPFRLDDPSSRLDWSAFPD